MITRRQIIKTLLALGAGSVLSSYLSAFADDKSLIRTALADAPTPLDKFRTVSTFITLRDDLDAAAVQAMHAVFMAEPWGPEHIDGLYNKMTASLKNSSNNKPPLVTDPALALTEGESWFAEHLLTTWYLGIYYHAEKSTKRILYETALMFKPLAGIIPIPFIEHTGFGAWAHPPEGIE